MGLAAPGTLARLGQGRGQSTGAGACNGMLSANSCEAAPSNNDVRPLELAC